MPFGYPGARLILRRAPGAGQAIVLERSTDGGRTWGGFTPGDNTPKALSQKAAIGGYQGQPPVVESAAKP